MLLGPSKSGIPICLLLMLRRSPSLVGAFRFAVLLVSADPIAAADPPAADDVGAQPAAVDERAQQRLARQLGQVLAGLAEARALAEGLADPEAAADEVVEADAPRRHVAPCLAGRKRDPVIARQVLDYLGLDQR
jgi:hypothetical protein